MGLETARRTAFDTGTSARAKCAHLYRRAGFGATEAELDAAVARGYANTVEWMCTADDPGTAALGAPSLTMPPWPNEWIRDFEEHSLIWWVTQRMIKSQNPLREKWPFLVHNWFTSSLKENAGYPAANLLQNQTVRAKCWGDFEELAYALTIDPAMQLWLNMLGSDRRAPNENYARELMELFALGRVDKNGATNYTENDVREAARALTGWRVNDSVSGTMFDAARWDSGPKTLFGQTGNWNARDVVRIVARHPASPRFVCAKVWSLFAYPVRPNAAVLDDLEPAFARHRDLTKLLRAIFLHPEFQSPRARMGMVKTPVEWLIGVVRRLNIPFDWQGADQLRKLGQRPFEPPSVAGWPANGYWLNSALSNVRMQVVQQGLPLVDLSRLFAAAPDTRADVVASMLGVDAWSERTRQALTIAKNEPASILALAVLAPEYLLN